MGRNKTHERNKCMRERRKSKSTERPIVISKMMMDLLLNREEKWVADVLALYLFYYYTMCWQDTLTPKCTTSYAAKALRITEARVRRAKKVLIDLDMISDEKVSIINKQGQNVLRYYIKVHYYDSVGSRFYGDQPFVETTKSGDKCIQTNKETTNVVPKCSQTNTPGASKAGNQGCVIPWNFKPLFPDKRIPDKPTFSDRMSKKLYIKVKSKNQLPFNSKSRSSWTTTFTKMLKEDDGRTKKRIRTVLEWYINHYGEPHVPEARCANSFRKKFCEIESAMNKWLDKNGLDKKESDSPSVVVRNVGSRIMD